MNVNHIFRKKISCTAQVQVYPVLFLISLFCILRCGSGLNAVRSIALIGIFFLICENDVNSLRIPNRCIISCVMIWLVSRIWAGGSVPASFSRGILTAGLAGIFMMLFRQLTGKIMKRRVLGMGDIKLIMAMGLFLAPGKLLQVLTASCILGILTGLFYRRRCLYFPFGPAICMASFAVMI